MKTIFGIDSKIPANLKLKNGYTMYNWVMRQKGFPKFWGRQISGENAVTKEELEFLKSKNCKLLLLFDDFTEEEVSGGYDSAAALRAVDALKKLGVPKHKGIVIYADINPDWSIYHDWMLGFASELHKNGYVAGFIGNTDSAKNFNFDRQCSHYKQSLNVMTELSHTCFGATEPQVSNPKEWAPYCPSEMGVDELSLWRHGTVTFDTIFVNSVLARDDEVLKRFWDIEIKETE